MYILNEDGSITNTEDGSRILPECVLEVHDAVHALTSEQPTLNELKILEVRNSAHVLTSTSPAPVQLTSLSVNDSYHALTSMAAVDSAYILNEDGTLVTAEDGKHVITETTIQDPTLIELKTLAVDNAAHGLTSESPVLEVYYPAHIVNEDESNLTTEDGKYILTEDAMAVDDGAHALTSDSPTLIELKVLAVDDCAHVLISDTPTLNEAKTLAINNGYHSLSSDTPVLVLDTESDFILTEDRDILTTEDGKHIVREGAVIFQAAWARNSNVIIQVAA